MNYAFFRSNKSINGTIEVWEEDSKVIKCVGEIVIKNSEIKKMSFCSECATHYYHSKFKVGDYVTEKSLEEMLSYGKEV